MNGSKLKFLLVIFLLAFNFTGVAHPDDATSANRCLQIIQQRISPDQYFSLTLMDSSAIRGQLRKIELDLDKLTLYNVEGFGERQIGFDEISMAHIPKSRRVKPIWMFGGAAAGALIGLVISKDSGVENVALKRGISALTGAGVGLVLGFAVPLLSPGSETISCISP